MLICLKRVTGERAVSFDPIILASIWRTTRTDTSSSLDMGLSLRLRGNSQYGNRLFSTWGRSDEMSSWRFDSHVISTHLRLSMTKYSRGCRKWYSCASAMLSWWEMKYILLACIASVPSLGKSFPATGRGPIGGSPAMRGAYGIGFGYHWFVLSSETYHRPDSEFGGEENSASRRC